MTSMYHYAQPAATHRFSDNTKRHATMAGVEHQYRIQCHGGCGERKPQAGGTRRNGKFICADCRETPVPNWFSAMATGEIAIPTVPQSLAKSRYIRKNKIGATEDHFGRDYTRLVLNAMNAGYKTVKDIAQASGVNKNYVREELNAMQKEGIAEQYRRSHSVYWRLK